ncbi:hypothetical protein GH714_007953 [Hevea brasiliensis]|uniref:BAG domain-containing protein n=1 Tax=Hevea brasiliensis TaxID=3981 RepID=A0A6A6KHX5_HEVBR|nr:hypothetical protein GH714_007953 [Hevea brasiliensis]
MVSEEEKPVEMKEHEGTSKAEVSALVVAVKGGGQTLEEEFSVSSEFLMRQLLKFDTIQAEGEPKVHCVQNYHDLLDNLKASNSKPFSTSSSSNAVSVTTEWETFDSGLGSSSPSPPSVSSSTRINQDWERFD